MGRGRFVLAPLGVLVIVVIALALLFPPVLAVVEMAARELRVFWWVILLVALGAWMVWGLGRKREEG